MICTTNYNKAAGCGWSVCTQVSQSRHHTTSVGHISWQLSVATLLAASDDLLIVTEYNVISRDSYDKVGRRSQQIPWWYPQVFRDRRLHSLVWWVVPSVPCFRGSKPPGWDRTAQTLTEYASPTFIHKSPVSPYFYFYTDNKYWGKSICKHVF